MHYEIEKFINALGEARFRFVTESTLHKGKPNRSLKSWKTSREARLAATRSGFTRRPVNCLPGYEWLGL